jgi:hypothetical protein
VVKPQIVGTIQYIEWLILNDRVQPSLIAGVCDAAGTRAKATRWTTLRPKCLSLWIRCEGTPVRYAVSPLDCHCNMGEQPVSKGWVTVAAHTGYHLAGALIPVRRSM